MTQQVERDIRIISHCISSANNDGVGFLLESGEDSLNIRGGHYRNIVR